MPSIASRLASVPINGGPGVSTGTLSSLPPSNGSPGVSTGTMGASPPSIGLPQPQPVLSSILRCPLPTVGFSSTPDNLRQYYAGGVVPQYRLTPATPLSPAPKQAPPTGLSTTIVTAKITPGGNNGSITLTDGILTALVPAT